MSLLLINPSVLCDLNRGSFFILTKLNKPSKTWQLLNYKKLYRNVRILRYKYFNNFTNGLMVYTINNESYWRFYK